MDIARRFAAVGYKIFATRGTARTLANHGVKAYEIRKLEQESPNILDLVLGHRIDLIIDIPAQGAERSHDGFIIRRNAIETGVHVLTSLGHSAGPCDQPGESGEEADPHRHRYGEECLKLHKNYRIYFRK